MYRIHFPLLTIGITLFVSPAYSQKINADTIMQRHFRQSGELNNANLIRTYQYREIDNDNGQLSTFSYFIITGKKTRTERVKNNNINNCIITQNARFFYDSKLPDSIRCEVKEPKLYDSDLHRPRNESIGYPYFFRVKKELIESDLPGTYAIKLENEKGYLGLIYIDAENYRLIKFVGSLSQGNGTITYHDYKRNTFGLEYPSIVKCQTQTSNNTLNLNIRINEDLPDSLFIIKSISNTH